MEGVTAAYVKYGQVHYNRLCVWNYYIDSSSGIKDTSNGHIPWPLFGIVITYIPVHFALDSNQVSETEP